jgi:hypothetical protein
MAKELIEIDVFDAGLNTKADPINLLPGQSDYMNNILFGDYGSIMTRGRISTYNSTPITGSPEYFSNILGMHSYRPATMSAQLVVACAGNAYIMTGASTFPVLISGATGFCTKDEAVNTVEMNGLLFLAGAGNMMKKYNGVEFTRAGVSAPTQVLSAACNAAGTLTGEYQYVYWGVNSYLAEGDYIATPSPVKTIASGAVRVSNIPTAPASYGIETWKIGRNTAGASGIFWYLTDKTNGVTSFTDNVADADLDELAPTDQGYPRIFRFTCVYGGRLWGAVDEYLWYSNVDQPEEFPSTNFIRVAAGSGLKICSIVPFMGMIVISLSAYSSPPHTFDANGDPTSVFTSAGGAESYPYTLGTALYVLRIGDSIGFSDPENWYLNLIAQNEGAESNGACIPVAGYLWMTGRGGVSLFNGSSIASGIQETIRGGIAAHNISDPINSLFSLANPSHIRLACAIEWRNRVYLSLDRTSGYNGSISAANDTTLIYDYSRVGVSDPRKGAWSKIDSMGAQKFIVHEDQLLAAGAKGTGLDSNFVGAYIYKWDNGTFQSAATATSPLYYRMSAIRGKKTHVYNDKDFRFVNVWASGTGTLLVNFKVNGVDYDTASTISTSSITLTSTGEKTKITLPGRATGKHLWIQFSVDTTSGGTLDLSIAKVQVFYNLRGLRNA